MDGVILFAIVAIVLLIVLIMSVDKTLPSAEGEAKSKAQKQREIIAGYKLQLDEALTGCHGEQLREQKAKMLKAFSHELSRNLFFDHDEMREAIGELAHYEAGGTT